MFWVRGYYGIGFINVWVNGIHQGEIKFYCSTGYSTCEDEDFVIFNGVSGEYWSRATGAYGVIWEGYLTIEEDECL